MAFLRFLFPFLIGVLNICQAQDFYVVAPNTLRLNSDETIAVAVDGPNSAELRVLIQDLPGKQRDISQMLLTVQPGQPEVFKVHLNPDAFPTDFFNLPRSQKFVSLTVQSNNFKKEITIPISTQSGYVFIQTDKPIYTPKQIVHMRIIPLNEDRLPSDEDFKLQIKNPNGNIVQEKIWNLKSQTVKQAFATHAYKFPKYPLLGKWTATVTFGHQLEQNSTVSFELMEYVLPTFTVKLETQDVILPTTETIKIKVLAKHVYGKNVQGMVRFRLGVKPQNSETRFFAIIGPKELHDGAYTLRLKTDDLKDQDDIGWFPRIEGSHLVVDATVVDEATGNKEVAVDSKARFSTSPFIISFKRCLKDFKPGHVSIFEADIKHIDGTPATGIPAKIRAISDDQELNIVQDTAISDENGKVAFEFQPEVHHTEVLITIETDDPRYPDNQAIGRFQQLKFESPSRAYIALARRTENRLQPGDKFARMVYFEPEGIRDIYYLVVARGKILMMNKLPPGEFKTQRVEFEISYEMVPSFRVVVFAHYGDELIADSLKIEVENICNPEAEVAVTAEFISKEPGYNGKFIIRGAEGTFVGLLGVDEAVYALSKKDILTKSKVFGKVETHDLGCGPGGGRNVDTILGNAGVTIGTNKYSPSPAHSCDEIKRRKREAATSIVSTFAGVDRICCSLGIEKDKHNRNCQERTDIVVQELNGQFENCSKSFLECCIYAEENGLSDLKLAQKGFELARLRGEDLDDPVFISPEEEEFIESTLTVRNDFRETWIFNNFSIGLSNVEEFDVSLPHSITTWVIQAVSVSPKYGICVIEPQKLVSFKKVFLHLNLPYSVVRNEQVEIQATLFNYGDKNISALLYMYGAENLCTGIQPGQKSGRKRLIVKAHSADSVSFPVIPLQAENFPIKVVALTPEGSDVIVKTLHVVLEGVPKQIDIPIKLDPTNQQQRLRRAIETPYYSDTIDTSQNLQVTGIKLCVPEGFVPGSASCSISAIGDDYGTVIETSINNPDELLILPGGCGEQNMARLAPTLYTMRYLKVTGKLTADMEETGYTYIRDGYDIQLKFRKEDGSYSAFPTRSATAWLTAFVIKVFCQASELIYIDKDVLCSGVRWLIDNQEPDGSFIETNPAYMSAMLAGVDGKIPMTAYTLMTFQECRCDDENLFIAKMRALTYLEQHVQEVADPLPTAIVAYALALSNSDLKQFANDRLLTLATIDEDRNMMHWNSTDTAQDIQTAGYALLTQLLLNDLIKSNAIVNWLNTKQLQCGSYKSTQDTVVALQALSEYAIRAQRPSINLVANLSSNNDRNFHKVLTFQEDNALVLQDVKVDKIGGTLFVNTKGHGTGSLVVKLRYNLNVPPEEICKFDVTVNVSSAKIEEDENVLDRKTKTPRKGMSDVPAEVLTRVAAALGQQVPVSAADLLNRGIKFSNISLPKTSKSLNSRRRTKRQNSALKNSKPTLKISLCVRFLGDVDAGMSIVDIGIFSGYEPIIEDLQRLQSDPDHLIDSYEKSSRGVVLYLRKVPSQKNYCFSFHVMEEFLIGSKQTSVIKVYDYYNPDATCTKFYSPSSQNPRLHVLCENGVCQCAEGGCPPKNPFPTISSLKNIKDRRRKLKAIACDKYDYVWIGHITAEVKKVGGFLNISFFIEEVIKEGIEEGRLIEDEVRYLLARDNCHETSPVFPGQTYLILGKDGQKYKNFNGDVWYRYLLDQNSVVHRWTDVRDAVNKDLQRDLLSVTQQLVKKGCEL